MILATSLFCKVAAVLAVCVFAYFRLKKLIPLKVFIWLSGLFLCFAYFSNYISSFVPPLKDEVTITALGERSAASDSDEIMITSFSVDGVVYPVEEAIEGKWFWIGERYVWRPESDRRQPDGTTRSVVLEVPVGWERSVIHEDTNKGYAEISFAGVTARVDTTVPNYTHIGASSKSALILNQIRYLAVYAMVLYVLSLAVTMLIQYKGQVARFLKKKWFYVAVGTASCITLMIMLPSGGVLSIWYDELAQLHLSMGTFSHACLYDSAMPPLYNMVAWLWYRVAPFGEGWLRLPNMISVAAGIYLVGLCGKQIRNERTGTIAAFLAAINVSIIRFAGLEYRSYGLFFFLSALLLYRYFIRLTGMGKETWRQIIGLGIAMSLASYTHYFGVFMSGALFLIDCYLFLKKKMDKKAFTSYGIAVVLYIPWIYLQITGFRTGQSWQPIPKWKNIPEILRYLSGNISLLYFIFCVGAVVVTYRYILAVSQKKADRKSEFVELVPLVVMVLLIGCVFFYGRQIGWLNTFWLNRYFLGLVVCVSLLGALGIEHICLFVERLPLENPKAVTAVICSAAFVLSLLPQSVNSTQKMLQSGAPYHEPYRQAIQWLYEQEDYIYNDETLVIEPWNLCTMVLKEYYITKQGERLGFELVSGSGVREETLLENDRVYLSYVHARITDELQSWLDTHYILVEDNEAVKVKVYDKISDEG